ncbi:hypothetical protein DRP43_05225 [candidate division TA06 bacterium]|uniref:Secretion system C-terminal sorting domain-containing protein n=1 Tax=candidate division TA06 bacterium TaxID=2250710 RepID=A0A660SD31_UNCT6|nr:MAG: hypothetical protein DRP43_05225 [candidate division TA06 bacterium]
MSKNHSLRYVFHTFLFLLILVPMVMTADSWVVKTSMTTGRKGLATEVVNGKIYAIGGYRGSYSSANEEYNPVTNLWITKASMPTARYCFASGVVNGKIYAIGGRGNSGCLQKNEEYDPVTDTWDTTKALLPTTRENMLHEVIDGKIYVIGGDIDYSTVFSVNEEYNPTADTVGGTPWVTKASIPTARYGFASGVVNGTIYAIGGGDSPSTYSSANEEYNPQADTVGGIPWVTKTSITTARKNIASGVVDGKIYAIGGWNGSNLSVNEEYDPIADTTGGTPWTTRTSMPTERNGVSAAVVNNKIYAIGGYTWSYTRICEEYNPQESVHDIGITNIICPEAGLIDSGYYAVSGNIKNYGNVSESFDVYASVYDTVDGWNLIFTDIASVSDLYPSDSINVIFDSTYFSINKVYYTKIYVTLPDTNFANDTLGIYSSTEYYNVMYVEDAQGYGSPQHPDTTWLNPLVNLIGSDNIYWFGPTAHEFENGPSLKSMNHADLVIWNCYDYYSNPSFTDYDTTNISDYIAGGGKIWLVGQDIVYSNTDKGKDKIRNRGARTVCPWLTNNFGVDSVYEDYLSEYTMNIQGQNEILGNIIPVVSDFDPGYDGWLYPDELYPGSNAHLVLADPDSNFCIGVISNDSTTSFWAADGRGADLSPDGDWETLIKDMLHIFKVPILGIKTNIGDIGQNREVNLIVKRTLGSDIYFTYKGIKNADISVNDISGRVIRKYKNVKPDSKLIFKGKSISSGVYFIKVNGKKIITKVSIIK